MILMDFTKGLGIEDEQLRTMLGISKLIVPCGRFRADHKAIRGKTYPCDEEGLRYRIEI
jgi:hypothetical protein